MTRPVCRKVLKRLNAVLACLIVLLVLCFPVERGANPHPASSTSPFLVYVGTYTGPKSKGIYVYRMDPATGAMTSLGVGAETKSPSFLAIHPNRRFLYAVNEIDEFAGKKSGAVSAFAIDPETGKLTLLDRKSVV